MSEKKKASFSLAPWKQLLPIVLRYRRPLVVIIVSASRASSISSTV